jgi:hypothetical protein
MSDLTSDGDKVRLIRARDATSVVMRFQITEEEAREMARLEEECGCDISAGPDWGIHLDKVMELALHSGSHNKFIDLLNEQFGNVMSSEEIEEMAASFQMQIQERLAGKVSK